MFDSVIATNGAISRRANTVYMIQWWHIRNEKNSKLNDMWHVYQVLRILRIMRTDSCIALRTKSFFWQSCMIDVFQSKSFFFYFGPMFFNPLHILLEHSKTRESSSFRIMARFWETEASARKDGAFPVTSESWITIENRLKTMKQIAHKWFT